jgi:hypothetical protein
MGIIADKGVTRQAEYNLEPVVEVAVAIRCLWFRMSSRAIQCRFVESMTEGMGI